MKQIKSATICLAIGTFGMVAATVIGRKLPIEIEIGMTAIALIFYAIGSIILILYVTRKENQ